MLFPPARNPFSIYPTLLSVYLPAPLFVYELIRACGFPGYIYLFNLSIRIIYRIFIYRAYLCIQSGEKPSSYFGISPIPKIWAKINSEGTANLISRYLDILAPPPSPSLFWLRWLR